MVNHIHSLALFVTAFIITLITTALGLAFYHNAQENLTLQNTVQQAIYANRDDNARTVRGLFALDINSFQNQVTNAKSVKELISNRNNKYGDAKIVFKYLTATKNEFPKLDKYQPANTNCKAITALKAIIAAPKKQKNGTIKYVATDVTTYVISSKVTIKDNDISAGIIVAKTNLAICG